MGIRWVDTNKGDNENPEYRSRIVAKDLKTKRDPNMPAIDTFAPMPALEMLKLMLSLASEWRKSFRGGSLTIMVVDVKRAHWNAAARRVIYIQLPDDDYEEGMWVWHSRPSTGSWTPPPAGMRRSARCCLKTGSA